ncbi:MAG: hypothetical protein H3C49_05020 [Alphaproteobacteria bacterium]|nr:hypothetical protein [Alphaproteobacteria bacterium]
MMMRPAIVAALLAVGLIFTAVPLSAQALRSEPGEWVVGPINIKSSNGLSFCSMKTRYANGHSLVVASDSKGARSLAIDFGKKSLTAGSQYYVTFYVGPIHRTMVAIAATTDVLIAQMGDDRDFFDMMRSKDVLDADFNNQQLSFSLKGAAQALDELATCTSAQGQGQAYTQAKLPTPAQAAAKAAEAKAVAAELARNEDMKISEQAVSTSLSDEIQRLREENRRLQLENQAVSARLQEGDLAAAQAELTALAELERRERALKIENERLRDETDSMLAVQESLTPSTRTPGTAAEAVSVRFQTPPPQAIQPAAGHPAAQAMDDAVMSPDPEAIEAAVVMPKAQAPKPIAARTLAWLAHDGSAAETAGGISVWRWVSGNSLVAVQPWPAAGTSAVAEYLSVLEARCGGDFAQQAAAPVVVSGNVNVVTAEVACIDADNQAAAVLAFISDSSEMAVVTFETGAETISDALGQRQSLLARVSGE